MALVATVLMLVCRTRETGRFSLDDPTAIIAAASITPRSIYLIVGMINSR
jgi:hypothetical protein